MDRLITLYSSKPVTGQFCYHDKFLIRPPNSKPPVPYPSFDHPFVIQFDETLRPDDPYHWSKSLWDSERLDRLKNGFNKNASEAEFAKWLSAHQQINEMRIPHAITNEIIYLINFFSNSIVNKPSNDQTWATPATALFTPEITPSISTPVICNYYTGDETYLNQKDILLRWPAIKEVEELIGVAPYRHAYIVGEEYNELKLPSNFENTLDIYFRFKPDIRLATYTAIASYDKSLHLRSEHPTLSLISLVIGIECLIRYISKKSPQCPECNAPISSDRCEKCDMPIYKLKSDFVGFMNKYAGDQNESLYRRLYDVRSQSVHGGLLRAEFHDTGFHLGEKDEQQLFLDNSIVLCRFAILNWIINSNEAIN